MQLVKQYSLFLENKPGLLAQVARQLAKARINVLAMTMMDSSEHGVLRMVVSDGVEKFRAAVAELNLPMTETDVLLVEMPNKPGSLADVCGKLAEAHINISYAYCTTGAPGGKTNGVFKVADMNKAMKVLRKTAPKHRDTKKKVRPHIMTR
ncbi:MAG TPA: ACT domain-containing protein [Phycisphaerae bacterium]|nr:ACT domain-containing protein [Phycisphaerae bacterium]HOJ74933.1 ACT domain-containing protein [Phycisphaerae bacterium]HOM51494.1 ACT domain-containing protein [Phycisphaerae bacterium]HOQ87258.1 ACT domain-containing protein [Phycisphaerae bacterium]HPP27022.1 ACT domain-containing protein [Phycisphaerae bacterium]